MARRFGAVGSQEISSWSMVIGSDANFILDGATDGDYGNSPFNALINGVPTATSVPYDTATGHVSLAVNLVLHNTTKNERVRVSGIGTPGASGTLTVEANSPDDASTWANNDVITTASQINTGRAGVYMDIDVTAFVAAGAHAIHLAMSGKYMSGGAEQFSLFHPYEAYAESKELLNIEHQATWLYSMGWLPLVWADSRAYITWCVLGSASRSQRVNLRYGGESG